MSLTAGVRVMDLYFQLLLVVMACLGFVPSIHAGLHSPSRLGCHNGCGGHLQLLLGVEGTTGKSHLHSSSRCIRPVGMLCMVMSL
jgi:hypothetical protein